MTTDQKLSPKGHWDEILKNAKLPLQVKDSQYSTWVQNEFFKNIILQNQYKSLIEIGAGSSAWLPFLAKSYNLQVSGLDYSELGCKICEENLKLLNINYEEVICEDILAWHSKKKYDIVISFGVVEHFEKPEDLIQIFMDHLNPGGIIITIIPNLLGLPGRITKSFIPDVYYIHKVISDKNMSAYHESCGLTTVKCDYTGMFYPMIIPWVSKKGFFFKPGTRRRKFILYILSLLNFISTKVLRNLKFRVSSEVFSPFVIYVGRKPNSLAS